MSFNAITPNHLTMFRIVLAFVIPMIFLQGGIVEKTVATALYIVAALTDALDGILARRRQQITTFGKIVDPIADKLLLFGALIAFIAVHAIRPWWLIVIFARELAVTVVRMRLLRLGKVVAAAHGGKIKVIVQHIAVLLLFTTTFDLTRFGPAVPGAAGVLAFIALGAATGMTLISGYEFFKVNGYGFGKK